MLNSADLGLVEDAVEKPHPQYLHNGMTKMETGGVSIDHADGPVCTEGVRGKILPARPPGPPTWRGKIAAGGERSNVGRKAVIGPSILASPPKKKKKILTSGSSGGECPTSINPL